MNHNLWKLNEQMIEGSKQRPKINKIPCCFDHRLNRESLKVTDTMNHHWFYRTVASRRTSLPDIDWGSACKATVKRLWLQNDCEAICYSKQILPCKLNRVVQVCRLCGENKSVVIRKSEVMNAMNQNHEPPGAPSAGESLWHIENAF